MLFKELCKWCRLLNWNWDNRLHRVSYWYNTAKNEPCSWLLFSTRTYGVLSYGEVGPWLFCPWCLWKYSGALRACKQLADMGFNRCLPSSDCFIHNNSLLRPFAFSCIVITFCLDLCTNRFFRFAVMYRCQSLLWLGYFLCFLGLIYQPLSSPASNYHAKSVPVFPLFNLGFPYL